MSGIDGYKKMLNTALAVGLPIIGKWTAARICFITYYFGGSREDFKMIVAVYFGIYTAYTLIVAFAIKRNDDAENNSNEVEGHDAQYWHKCFLYQKDRADKTANGNKMTPFENAEPTTEHLREVTKMIEDEPKELPDIREEINAERQDADIDKTILSIKRAFARIKDPDKRRERIKSMPPEVQAEIKKLYDL